MKRSRSASVRISGTRFGLTGCWYRVEVTGSSGSRRYPFTRRTKLVFRLLVLAIIGLSRVLPKYTRKARVAIKDIRHEMPVTRIHSRIVTMIPSSMTSSTSYVLMNIFTYIINVFVIIFL